MMWPSSVATGPCLPSGTKKPLIPLCLTTGADCPGNQIASDLKRRRVTFANPGDFRGIAGEVHYRGGFHSAEAAVDDQIQFVFQGIPDFVGVGHRLAFPRQNQGAEIGRASW